LRGKSTKIGICFEGKLVQIGKYCGLEGREWKFVGFQGNEEWSGHVLCHLLEAGI
jgi:hypothetical protein